MIDPTREVNMSQLNFGCTPHPSMDNPIIHNGWEIYKWTGWKGNTAIFEAGDHLIEKVQAKCTSCGKLFQPGDRYIESQGIDDLFHFECSDSPTKGQIIGQWLAVKKGILEDRSDYKFAYASVPGSDGAYKKFQSFDVTPTGIQGPLTPETPIEILEAAREDGLVRLKKYLDDVESGNAPWPEFWGPKPE